MNRLLVASAFLAALTVVTGAQANEKLAQASGCMTCHAINKRVIGPTYKEVADKYRNDKQAESKLVQKVKAGGKGVWGEMPMPPNAHVKDEDVKMLVQWILSQK
jgi:cytochrome c